MININGYQSVRAVPTFHVNLLCSARTDAHTHAYKCAHADEHGETMLPPHLGLTNWIGKAYPRPLCVWL